MNITPHLGIGDLLIIKMIQISHKLDIINININHELIVDKCENYDQKIYTITKFVELLFPNTTYHINNNKPNFPQDDDVLILPTSCEENRPNSKSDVATILKNIENQL
jgi:uncharacterized membrane protein